jgi:hypothetical protein
VHFTQYPCTFASLWRFVITFAHESRPPTCSPAARLLCLYHRLPGLQKKYQSRTRRPYRKCQSLGLCECSTSAPHPSAQSESITSTMSALRSCFCFTFLLLSLSSHPELCEAPRTDQISSGITGHQSVSIPPRIPKSWWPIFAFLVANVGRRQLHLYRLLNCSLLGNYTFEILHAGYEAFSVHHSLQRNDEHYIPTHVKVSKSFC